MASDLLARRSGTARFSTGKMKWDTVLIDLSGTLIIEDQVIPGSVEALNKLRASNLKVKFVTNTTKEPRRQLHEKLTKLGFDIRIDEIFTSLTAARNVLEKKKLRPFYLLEDAALEDFRGIETSQPNSVLVGLAPSKFNYKNMNEAFNLLVNGASLVAVHKGRYYMKTDGALHLGPGAFVEGLEYASDKKAEVVGKPEKKFFHEAVSDLGSEPKRTVMIGDDVRDDVVGAIEAGFTGILVKTGKYRSGDESSTNPKPDHVFDSFVQAVDHILSS